MTIDRWERLERLFHEAAELPAGQRAEYINSHAGDEPDLAKELQRLLQADDQPNIVDRPIVGERPAPSTDAPEIERAGEQIGPYKLISLIAGGGMGLVYRAERTDGLYNIHVAIKLIRHGFNSRAIVRRFMAERQALANLNHPNIARLLDGGTTDDGEPYLVMEFVQGRPIDEYCDANQLSVTARLELFAQVCHAVHAAHQNLVVHRDLKPSNILITDDGQPKLLDFGIAKLLSPDQPVRLDLAATERLLTPDYASPEQVQGAAVTTATDIYSLGVILYRLLTGRRPYHLTSVRLDEIERAICEQTPSPPSVTVSRVDDQLEAGTTTLPTIPPRRLRRMLQGDLDNIALMALRKEPSRRYASAEQFAEDIHRYLKGLPVTALRDTIWYRMRKFVSRHRSGVAAAALVALTLVGGIIGTTAMARLRGIERDAAIAAGQRADREALAARLAEETARAEAAHAEIEAESAQLLANYLTDAFLISASSRSPQELEQVRTHLGWLEHSVRAQYGDSLHLQANLFDAIGRVYLGLNLHARAEELIREAATIRNREFGSDSVEAALSYNSLGELAHAAGDYDTAVEHFEVALRIQRDADPGVHTDIPLALNNLGAALRHVGRFEESQQHHLESLAMREQSLGRRSMPAAESMDNLAHVYMQTGRLDEAADLLEEVAAIRAQLLGRGHPLTAQTHNNLATVFGQQHRYADAAEQFRLAVASLRIAPHLEPIGLAQSLKNLSRLVLLEGDIEQAEQHLDEAITVVNTYAEDDHPLRASLFMQQAQILEAQERFAAAGVAWQAALDAQLALPPRDKPATAHTMMGYGMFLFQQERYHDALPLLIESESIYGRVLPQPHRFRAIAQSNLGRCLVMLNRPDEARAMFNTALAEFEATSGAHSDDYRKVREHLDSLAEAATRPGAGGSK